MSLIDDLKAKADRNGDGKLNAEDLESLKDGLNNEQLDRLKQLADRNQDGKLSWDDVKNIDFGELVSDAKDNLSGLFGNK